MRKSLLTSTTLAVLKLKGPFIIKVLDKTISLPNLKTLHLVRLGYEKHETIRRLFAGCPVLENLVVKRFDPWDGVSCFDITSPALKNLDLQADLYTSDDDVGDDDGDDDCFTHWPAVPVGGTKIRKFEINAPSLEYINMKDNMSMELEFKDVSSLVSANLDIWRDAKDSKDYDSVVSHLLQGLSHVKFLSLSKNTVEMLAAISPFSAPKLRKLIKLTVDMKKKRRRAQKVIQSLTRRSKKLEEIKYK